MSEVEVFLPLPGSKAAVAYFKLNNHSSNAIIVDAITSPQFGTVEIHETTIKDGVARMRAISQVKVEAKSALSFEAGGKHLMLMQPRGDSAIDSPVTLEIHYDQDGLMIVTASMRSRSVH